MRQPGSSLLLTCCAAWPLLPPLLQVRQVMLPASEATGPSKARALAQQLWEGEEFHLQARTMQCNTYCNMLASNG